MPDRILSVGDDFTLRPEVKVADINLPARLAPEALSATYASQFTATGTTTAADVTAWLAVAYKGVKRLTGTLTISAPITIKSNTTLDATGATITSTHVGHMIRNENYASATVRDKSISIIGGTWQRNAGGQSGGTVNGDSNGSHSIFLRHVDRLVIQGLTVGSTGGKYMIAIGDITDFHVADINAESVASDTVHMTGPCSDGVVERVRVRSGGDDVVAFTTTDYISYNDVHGNFANITVRDVTGNNSTRSVLVAASASGTDDAHSLAGIVVENVKQLGAGAGVWVGSPWTTAAVTDLTIRNVSGQVNLRHRVMTSVTVENSGPVIVAPDGAGAPVGLKRLVIRNPRTAPSELVLVSSADVTIDSLEVEGATFTGQTALRLTAGTIKQVAVRRLAFAGTGSAIFIGAAVTQFTLDGLTGTIPATESVFKVQGATGVVGTITVTNPDYTAADTNSGILVNVDSAGKVGTLNVTGGKVTNIGRLLEVAAGSTGTLRLNLANVVTTGCNRIMQAGGATVEVSYANVSTEAMINQPFRIHSGGVLNVRGTGFRGYTASAIVRGATEVIRVVAPDLPVDLSILAKNNGDTAHNTNAGLACGAGPAVSNGTNWKNVYSGATY